MIQLIQEIRTFTIQLEGVYEKQLYDLLKTTTNEQERILYFDIHKQTMSAIDKYRLGIENIIENYRPEIIIADEEIGSADYSTQPIIDGNLKMFSNREGK
jgi:ABC-type antimicrobial peptide transport system ATPase subunit